MEAGEHLLELFVPDVSNFSCDIALNLPHGVKAWYEIEKLINLHINRQKKKKMTPLSV